jgi:hypothetical protein
MAAGILYFKNKSTADIKNAATEASDAIIEKMRSIILPEIDFREASITDIVVFLSEASLVHGDPAIPVEERGVNFVLGFVVMQGYYVNDIWDYSARSVAPVTINCRFISLLDVLEMTLKMADLKFFIRDNVVIIMPNDRP